MEWPPEGAFPDSSQSDRIHSFHLEFQISRPPATNLSTQVFFPIENPSLIQSSYRSCTKFIRKIVFSLFGFWGDKKNSTFNMLLKDLEWSELKMIPIPAFLRFKFVLRLGSFTRPSVFSNGPQSTPLHLKTMPLNYNISWPPIASLAYPYIYIY